MGDHKSINPLTFRYLLEDDTVGQEVRAFDLLAGLSSRRLACDRRVRPLSGGDWRSLAADPELGPAARVVMADTRRHWSSRGRLFGMLRASMPLFFPLALLLLMWYLQVPLSRFLASWRILLPAILGQFIGLACLYHFWSGYLPGHGRRGASFWFMLPYVNVVALWVYYRGLLRRLPERRRALPGAALVICCAVLLFFYGVVLLAPSHAGGGAWVATTNAILVISILCFNLLLSLLVAGRAWELDEAASLPVWPLQAGDEDAPMTHAWHAVIGRRLGYRTLAVVCAMPLFLLLLLGPPWYSGMQRWRRLREQYAHLPLDMQGFAALPLPEEPHAGPRLLRIGIPDFDLGLANHHFVLHADIIRSADPQWLENAKTRYDRYAPRFLNFRALLREAPHLGLLRPQLGVVRQGRDSVELAISKSREYGNWRLFAFRFAEPLGMPEEARAELLWEDFKRISDYEQDDLIRPLAVATAMYSRRLSLLQAVLPMTPEEQLPALLQELSADEGRIGHAARWQCLAENALFADLYNALARAGWEKASLFGLDHGARAEQFSYYARLMDLLDHDLYVSKNDIASSQQRAAQYGGLHFSLAQQSAGFMEMARQTARARLDNRLAHVAVAIERYRRRHGALPESLGALPKELLAELPRNPFDGTELRYEQGAIPVTVLDVQAGDKGVRAMPSRELMPGARLWALDDDGAEHIIKFF